MKHIYLIIASALLLPWATRAQNVGIGTTTPTQTLDVNGSLRVRGTTGAGTRLLQTDATGNVTPAATVLPATASAAPTLAATATGLNNPLVAASGTLAVVLNRGANPISLSLYDVSTPATPVLSGTYTGSSLAGAVSVAVSGTTAAVISSSSPYTVSVFTLGSGAPVLAATTAPVGATGVLGGVALVGNLLYAVTDKGANRGLLFVYDVSNPASPVQRNVAAGTPIGVFTPLSMAAAGTLVCITSPYADPSPGLQFSVLDVSNPAAPTVAATVGGTAPSGYTGNARPLAMSPGLVAVLRPEANLLSVYDLSVPTAPVLRTTYTTGANPVAVALNGALAYVACAGSNTLQVIDVSGATATLRGFVPIDATASSVAVTSAVVLAANKAAANDLQVFAQPTRTVVVYPDGTAATAATPGPGDYIQNQTATAQAGGFRVSGTGTIGGAATIGGTATVGAVGAPGQVLTPATGVHNMLAVAYGQVGSFGAINSGSGNFSVTRTAVGKYTIAFSASSGLATVPLDAYPIVMSLYGNTPGFVGWGTLNPTTLFNDNGTLYVSTYNAAGTAANLAFSFVVFQP